MKDTAIEYIVCILLGALVWANHLALPEFSQYKFTLFENEEQVKQWEEGN